MKTKLLLLMLGLLILGSAAKAQWVNGPTTQLLTKDSVLIDSNSLISSILPIHGKTMLRRMGLSTSTLSCTIGQKARGHFRHYLNNITNVYNRFRSFLHQKLFVMNSQNLSERIGHLLSPLQEINLSWILLSVAAAAMWLIAYRLLEEADDKKRRYGIGLKAKKLQPQPQTKVRRMCRHDD